MRLGSKELDFSYEKLAENGGVKPPNSDYAIVKEFLIKEFEKANKHEDYIYRAANATVDLETSSNSSVSVLDSSSEKDSFNGEAKFGLFFN